MWIILYYGLDRLILPGKRAPSRWLAFLSTKKRREILAQPRGARLLNALTQLGPLFIKFGQLLSVRQDILPADISNTLVTLQDQVAPFSSKLAMATIETIYKQPIDTLFKAFNPNPIASASIAQVHEATLHRALGT